MDLGLKNATVCINGGSRGIGRAAAELYAKEGARIIVTGRNANALDECTSALLALGSPQVFGIVADTGNPLDIERLFSSIEDHWGELNVLINVSHGGSPDNAPSIHTTFADTPDESWDETYGVIIRGVARMCRLGVPLMKKSGWGRIVNISSIWSRLGPGGAAPYMSAKAGLNALSKNMAWSLAKENILVNTVSPGIIYSTALRIYLSARRKELERDGYDIGNPADVGRLLMKGEDSRSLGAIGRVGLPEEVAPQIVLLGSKINTFIVGANVAVDGGTDWSIG